MRSRSSAQAETADVARRRLEALTAELALLREARGSAERQGSGGTVLPDDPAVPANWGLEEPPPAPGRHARRPVGLGRRAGGWVHDRLPPTMQGRVRLTPGHLSVVAVLVAAGFALTAWWVVRADGSTTVLPSESWSRVSEGQPPAPAAPLVETTDDEDTAAGPDKPTASDRPSEIIVDVAGKVRRPGIAALPPGSRVVDAVAAAGGARRGVDLTALNLARVLVDGEQVVVGLPPPTGVAAPAASETSPATEDADLMVNINVAAQTELEELPGIGPVTAAAILDWRAEHGAFTAVDELLEVSGIGDATLADIAPFVTL